MFWNAPIQVLQKPSLFKPQDFSNGEDVSKAIARLHETNARLHTPVKRIVFRLDLQLMKPGGRFPVSVANW